MKWFEQAGSNGYREAQYNLAHMYQYGSGGAPVNFTKAREWYEKAAAQGHAKAQLCLGAMHHLGEDFIQARYWYEQAAAQGKAEAMILISINVTNAGMIKSAREYFSK